MIAQQWTQKLFGAMGSSGGGSGGDLIGSILGLFGGSSSASNFGVPGLTSGRLPGFALGTSSAPGGWAMVGERGPEMVNLPRGSQVFPNGKGPRGGATINQTILVSENTSKATAEQLAFKAGQAAQVALARNS